MAATLEARRMSSLVTYREPGSPHSPHSPHTHAPATDRPRRPSRQLSRHLSEASLKALDKTMARDGAAHDVSHRDGRHSVGNSPSASSPRDIFRRLRPNSLPSNVGSSPPLGSRPSPLRREGSDASLTITDAQRLEQLAQRQKSFKRDLEVTKEMLANGFVINPNTWWMRRWDLLVLVALVFTAIVTPYEVAVVPEIV